MCVHRGKEATPYIRAAKSSVCDSNLLVHFRYNVLISALHWLVKKGAYSLSATSRLTLLYISADSSAIPPLASICKHSKLVCSAVLHLAEGYQTPKRYMNKCHPCPLAGEGTPSVVVPYI